MSEQGTEFHGDDDQDVEGHMAYDIDVPDADDVEGHVQPPRGEDTDHLSS